MAKRKKKKKKDGNFLSSLSGLKNGLAEETRHTILAIVFFVFGVLFLLAAFGQAGQVGEFLFTNLEKFLGVGYYLLPIIFLLLCVALLRAMRTDFAIPAAFGAVLFFLSSLGLLSTIFPAETGGVLGGWIASPLVSLFATPLTIIVLGAIIIISLLAIFDAKPSFAFIGNIFGKKEDAEEEEEEIFEEPEIIAGGSEKAEGADEKKTTEEEPEEAPEPEKKKGLFARKKKSEDEDEDYDDELQKSSHNKLDAEYTPPPLSLLTKDKGKPGVGDIKANTNAIKRTLRNFGIDVEMDEVSVGPSVTRYALKPAEGVKLSKITNLHNELALSLATHPVRIEAPIPKTSLVGIEVPNSTKSTIGLGSLLRRKEFQEAKHALTVALGKDVAGKPMYANIGRMPHLLIAGTTGSGKSVTVHTLITSLLYRNGPSNLRFIMVDPKRVEMTLYNGIPHLLSPVITDPKKAILALKWLAKEMNRRYDLLEEHKVRDIDSYHKNVLKKELKKKENKKKKEGDDDESDEEEDVERMPYIVVIIDELSDIMQAYPRELEAGIVRLAQMSRAVGIHVILSTQRPSVNVITGLIKANVPARIALQVASQVDSRTIIDQGGAEKLLGAGDTLFASGEMSKPTRLQSAFVTEKEVKDVVKYLQGLMDGEEPEEFIFTDDDAGSPDALFSSTIDGDDDEDDLYEEARETVIAAKKASTSYLQRKLKVGYSRAARLMDALEDKGVIGPAEGSKPRQVLEGADEGYGRDGE